MMLPANNNWRIPFSAFLLLILIAGSDSLFSNHCCYKDVPMRQGGNTEVCCTSQSDFNSSTCCRNLDNSTIHVGVFVPYLNEDRHGYKAAVLMAMDIINNNRTDLLDGGELVIHFGDTFAVSIGFCLCNSS